MLWNKQKKLVNGVWINQIPIKQDFKDKKRLFKTLDKGHRSKLFNAINAIKVLLKKGLK